MRTHGTLAKWNDDRGFGFIELATGSREIFVHISAFPRDGIRPRVGELVSFEIESRDGKSRAVRIVRPGSKATPRQTYRRQPVSTRQGLPITVVGLLAILAAGWYAYSQRADRAPSPSTTQAIQTRNASPAQSFTCDGRTRCSQMTSCAEATFFIEQCPGTQMDGDGDGVPCESQWCSGAR